MARIKISQLEESATAGYTIVTVNGESKKYNLATLETAVGQVASDYMTLSTAQNVSGVKNFQNGFNIGKANVVYDNNIDALVITFND
ncbi:MAG: hypothetical protein MJ197_08800 [Bacteroidales bacterium]|nr:hypothetical protein [Bacteroidales bacterium]